MHGDEQLVELQGTLQWLVGEAASAAHDTLVRSDLVLEGAMRMVERIRRRREFGDPFQQAQFAADPPAS